EVAKGYADGGRIHKADGGPALSDEDMGIGAAPAVMSDADMGLADAPKTPSWSDAFTDIPHEIGAEAGNALDKIKALGNRADQGPIEGLMTTGKAALAVPQLLASPVTGAARSLIGHPMAQAEHAAGTLINPEVAAKDDPAKMYQNAAGDVETALSA